MGWLPVRTCSGCEIGDCLGKPTVGSLLHPSYCGYSAKEVEVISVVLALLVPTAVQLRTSFAGCRVQPQSVTALRKIAVFVSMTL
jgi:hypothetical protein